MFFLLMALTLTGDVYSETVVTRNPDPLWVPQTYEEWLSGEPDFVPLVVTEIIRADDDAEILILLEEGLSDSLGTTALEQWVSDIGEQGLTVEVLEITYSYPWELRDYFISRLVDGLEGAVLVGQLPVPWCALDEPSWNDKEQFPTDYFYMDLDGTWEDLWIGYPSQGNPGQDGKYDTWSGELDPEIYIGRMRPNSISSVGDPIEMLQAYLERNHTWRLNGDPEPLYTLCYVDDDWAAWGPSYQNAMMLLYENVELVNDLAATNGTDYRDNRLPGNYVWISPYVHSGPTSHAWDPGPSTLWSDLVPANPPSRFYNLFACSNSRFTTPRNMGSIYALGTASGLGSIGSTKTGSMLQFSHFYYPMGQGSSIGEAFYDWWVHISSGGINQDEMQWHLGMSLIGDPTLIPSMHMTGIEGDPPSPGDALELDLCPNPATVSVQISTSGFMGEQCVLRMFDMSGRVCIEEILSEAGGTSTLDLTGLENGVYFVRVLSGSASVSRALIKLD